MADPQEASASSPAPPEYGAGGETRKEKRKEAKKKKRKQARKEAAIWERVEEEEEANDPEEQLRIRIREQEEAEATERERKAFEERERLWIEAAAARNADEDERRRLREASRIESEKNGGRNGMGEDDEWEYVEDGPVEIIWQGNEIIVKKKKVRVPKQSVDKQWKEEDDERPTSNPLPPQSEAFASYMCLPSISAKEVMDTVAQQTPNFGTEQDKTHCPFHLKTGACRFGLRCSRVHFHPDKSCTLLMRNMYNGPGLVWEQDESLEDTDEEAERSYEEFYEDVHTEFLKFGELINFKVCRNGAYHLRGNVYVHYKDQEAAILVFNTMNGRYYAGKQITCEFVAITRWKVAICGDYMKSALKGCSHGTACNFIHCFRNPGGEYEWADWDNPPPKYWRRKMLALFGSSDGTRYEKEMKVENQERTRGSCRKGTPSEIRYSSRSSSTFTHSEMDHHKSGSTTEVSDENRDQHYDSIRKNWSSKMKERALLGKHDHHEGKYRSSSHSCAMKYSSSHRDLSEDLRELERGSFKKQRSFDLEEKGDSSEDHKRHKRKCRPTEDLRSQQEYNGHSSPDQHSDFTNHSGQQRHRQTSEKSLGKQRIDPRERYDGRYCSDDLDFEKDSSPGSRIWHKNIANDGEEYEKYDSHYWSNQISDCHLQNKQQSNYSTEKDYDQYDSHNHTKKISYDHEQEYDGKSSKKDSASLRYTCDISFDSQDSRENDYSGGNSQDQSTNDESDCFSGPTELEDLGNTVEKHGHTPQRRHKKHSESARKRRHHQAGAEYNDQEQDTRHHKRHGRSYRERRHHDKRSREKNTKEEM